MGVIEDQAQNALKNGADPTKVQARLVQLQSERALKNGADPQQVQQRLQQLSASPAQPQVQPQGATNPFAAGVQAFNTAVEDVTRGALQLGAQAVGAEGFAQQQAQTQQQSEALTEQNRQQFPVAAAVGGGLGQLGLFAPTAAISAPTLLGRAAVSGAAVAVEQGLRVAEGEESRVGRAATGAVIGAALGAAGEVAFGAIKSAGSAIFKVARNNLFTPRAVKKDLANALAAGDINRVRDVVDSARRVGVKLTPGDITKSPDVLKNEAVIGLSDDIRELAATTARENTTNVVKEVGRFVQSITPEETAIAQQTVGQLFDRIDNVVVTPQATQKLFGSKIVRRTADRLIQTEALRGVDPTSVKFLRALKNELIAAGQSRPSIAGGIQSKTDRDLATRLGGQITEVINTAAPENKGASELFVRLQARKGVEESLRNLTNKLGGPVTENIQDSIDFLAQRADRRTVSGLYQAIVTDVEVSQSLQNIAKGMPNGTQRLNDLRTILSTIGPSASQLEKLARQNLSTGTGGSLVNRAINSVDSIYNNAYVELLTSDTLTKNLDQIARLSKKNTKAAASRFARLLSSTITRAGGKAISAQTTQTISGDN